MNAKLELVRNWLIKAQHDLAAARKLSVGPDPYLDVAISASLRSAFIGTDMIIIPQDGHNP